MAWIRTVPLFLLLLVLYNVVAFAPHWSHGFDLGSFAFAMHLPSQTTATFNVADLLVLAGIPILYIEIAKATRSSRASILDHILSMVVFIGFLLEFLLIPQAATPHFLFLLLMSLLDVIAGFTVTISTASRDVHFGNNP